jgi:hypothetical protein
VRKRNAVFIVAAVAVLFVGLVVLASFAPDVNEPDAFGIYFKNDLAQPVILNLCHSDHSKKCQHPYYRDHIAPGAAYPENISPDVRTEWAIEAPSGALLRCIVLYWKHYPGSDRDLLLSDAPGWSWPCSRTTTTMRRS